MKWRHLLLRRKSTTNLDSILKSRDVTLWTKVHIVFSKSHVRCEGWTIKAERQRIDTVRLWCWRRLFRVPWTARRSNKSILKEINPEYSLAGLMLKLQYFDHLMWRANSLEKTLMLRKIKGRRRKGTTEDEMVGWHHRLYGHEFEWTPGDGEGQASLACCTPWGHKELDMT